MSNENQPVTISKASEVLTVSNTTNNPVIVFTTATTLGYGNENLLTQTDGKTVTIQPGGSGNYNITTYKAEQNKGIIKSNVEFGGQNFLISQSDSLFPLAQTISLSVGSDFRAISVSPDDVNVMNSTLQFFQSITASPQGKLAQQFNQAITSSSSSKNPFKYIDSNFFAETTNYSNVTMKNYTVVMSWLHTYAYEWAQNAEYYVYTESSSQGQTTVSEIGTVGVTQTSNPSPASLTNYNSGYQFSLDFKKNPVTLDYSKGFLQNETETVSVEASFIITGLITGKASDTTISPVFVGMVSGHKAIMVPQKLPGKPATWNDVFNTIMKIAGLAFAANIMWELGTKITKAIKGGKDKAKDKKDAKAEEAGVDPVENLNNDPVENQNNDPVENLNNDPVEKLNEKIQAEQVNDIQNISSQQEQSAKESSEVNQAIQEKGKGGDKEKGKEDGKGEGEGGKIVEDVA